MHRNPAAFGTAVQMVSYNYVDSVDACRAGDFAEAMARQSRISRRAAIGAVVDYLTLTGSLAEHYAEAFTHDLIARTA